MGLCPGHWEGDDHQHKYLRSCHRKYRQDCCEDQWHNHHGFGFRDTSDNTCDKTRRNHPDFSLGDYRGKSPECARHKLSDNNRGDLPYDTLCSYRGNYCDNSHNNLRELARPAKSAPRLHNEAFAIAAASLAAETFNRWNKKPVANLTGAV
jgi:hypothetical protein